MQALRVMVRKTKRTDLMCMACGQFRTELEVVVRADGEPFAGVHTRCVDLVHHKMTRKKAAPAAGLSEEDVGEDLARHEAEVVVEEEASQS